MGALADAFHADENGKGQHTGDDHEARIHGDLAVTECVPFFGAECAVEGGGDGNGETVAGHDDDATGHDYGNTKSYKDNSQGAVDPLAEVGRVAEASEEVEEDVGKQSHDDSGR